MANSSPTVTIGLDCGTGGARAMVCDLDGRVLATASRDYATTFPRPGWATQSPAEWWQAACGAVREAVERSGVSIGQVAAICADGTSSTLVMLGENGEPLADAILWMDNRASPQARRIEQSGHPALRRSRAGVSAETAIPKILWLRDNDPDLFRQTRWFMELADYIALRLSNRLTLGQNHTINRWFFDPRRGGWPEDFFEAIGLAGITTRFPDHMPILGAPIGLLSAEAAAALGLTTETLVVCGGTDAYVATVGLNTLRPGETALITGTSHLVLPTVDDDVEIAGLFGPHPDCVAPGCFVMEGGQVSSGAVLRWWHDLFQDASPGRIEDMIRAAQTVPLGANGLMALDFWQGNRNPYTDYDLQGAIWGMTLKHSRADITRALLESVCMGTANILGCMERHGVAVRSMTAAGAALRSPFWLQMHADTAGVKLRIPEVGEATAFGAAIAAAVGVGAYGSLQAAADRMVWIKDEISPDPERHAEYRVLMELYLDTYSALQPLMHRMAQRNRSSPQPMPA
ncbi:xylulose kinase [Agrobacterium sp. a22-2]|uniref:FGGY-family carbohydrate kinase n=1 Tax=Agrobacterium sp. a22-2 TaxID=2283840 RepID=UPI0014483132|nr:FGGY family carbohydrate kinase [Agrobacterium sp. a22-2]NKN38174.1 xylulose kinase [Agrobacterium sp. a22-2]